MIRFSIIDTISERENSKVYLASVEGYDVPMIIKEQKNLNSHVLEKLQKINDPHFPKLVSFEEADGCFTILEEYIDGITLDAYFKKCRPDKQAQGKIFTEICAALKILHEQEPPIIHRDVKPSNILISENGQVRLIDFNASREFKTDSAKDTVSIGTRDYAPPEQFGFSQTDVRSDIYSLGVVISELSDAFPEIVKRCTMFSPEERYHSVGELSEDIEKSLSLKSGEALEDFRSDAGLRSGKKKLFAAVCVILAAAVLGAGFWLKQQMSEKAESKEERAVASAVTEEKSSKEKKQLILDHYNITKNTIEKMIYYILRDGNRSREYFLLGISWVDSSDIEEIQFRKAGLLSSEAVSNENWKKAKYGLEFREDFLNSLNQDAVYDVSVELKDYIYGFQLCVVDSFSKIPYDYKRFALSPDYVEYLRDHPEEKALTYNAYGRTIKKIVNQDTKEELKKEDYTVDSGRELILFSKEFMESLTDDRHITLRIYHSLIPELEEEEYYDIDAVTREDAYVPPELEKRDFIFNQSEEQDIEIRLKWNDANGHLEGIYPNDTDVPEIDKKYYQVKGDSIIISKEYFKKLEKKSYEYVIEFGDAGAIITVKVIV